MKTMIKILSILLLLIFSNSCVIGGGVKGNGNVVKKKIEVAGDFSSIKVQQGINVFLTQADIVKINAEMDENILELLSIKVENNKLSISFKKNVGKVTKKDIYLSCPKLISIAVSSGAEVTSVNQFATVALDLSASSGSELDLNILAESVEIDASSGADVDLEGKSNTLKASASSGSDIEADKLICNTVVADASSGASIDVYASKSINAEASSGASIECEGNPEKVNIEKSSGGSVKIK